MSLSLDSARLQVALGWVWALNEMKGSGQSQSTCWRRAGDPHAEGRSEQIPLLFDLPSVGTGDCIARSPPLRCWLLLMFRRR